MKRPTTDGHCGSYVATPKDGEMIQFLGIGATSQSVSLTKDQFKAIKKLYEFQPEKHLEKPPKPIAPELKDYNGDWRKYDEAKQKYKNALNAWNNWEDPQPFMQAGADRNVMRYADCDGVRLLAWIAKFLEPDEDPVKCLIRLAIDAGWDIDPSDVDWVNDSFDNTEK